MSWSLEGELVAMAESAGTAEALKSLGVCEPTCGECRIATERDWQRAGAETYALLARVTHVDQERAEIIYLKACVALGDLGGVSKIVAEWCSRRAALADVGISVPRLYGTYSGTIWEEYIPYALTDLLSQSGSAQRERLVSELGRTIGLLTGLGFPVLEISDWRSRGLDVVVVDYGEDLGPPRMVSPHHGTVLADWLALLERKDVLLAPTEIAAVGRNFELGLANVTGRQQ